MIIHFVWLGANQGPHCTATPIAVTKKCLKDEVWLWLLSDYAETFATALKGSKVTVKLLDREGPKLTAQQQIADAFNVLPTLIHHAAWAGAKDLAVLLILYKYGGLYLDTTCLLATEAERKRYESKRLHGVKARSLADVGKGLANSGPMLPLVKDDTIPYQPGANSVQAISVGYDMSVKNTYPILEMPHIDVWSYFSPPGHNVFLTAAGSYIARAKVLGLDDVKSQNTSGRDILVEGGRNRDELVGNLITASVLDGLNSVLGTDSDAIKRICWQAFAFNEEPENLPRGDTGAAGRDILPEIGIIKQYKNTHRQG